MKRFILALVAGAMTLGAQVATVPNTDFPTFRTNLNASLGTAVSTGGSYTNPSWLVSIPWAKVTGVPTFENPLTFSTGLLRSTNAITCVTATGSVLGCISAADWTTFNAKQAAISGAPGTWPTFYYQTLKVGGVAATQRANLNLINGTNVTVSCVDNSGTGATDCTLSATAGAGGYATVQSNGSGLTARSILNFGTEFTAVDNSGAGRTDITMAGIDAAKVTSGALAKARQFAATAYTDAGNTFSTGVQDFSAATHLRVPNAAGYTPTTNGHFGYDTTANAFKGYTGASVHTFAFLDSSITGNAATATALASTPTLCSAGNAPTGVLANGNATGCAAIGGGGGGTGNAASVVTATFSATPTFTCPSSSAGTVTSFKLSTALTANITSSTLASCTTGQTLNFTFTQDGTGGRTVAMPTGFTQACTVNPVASSITNMSFYWDGATAQKLSCSTDSGPSFSGPESDVAGAGTPAASKGICGWDQTNHIFSCKQNNSATVSNAVVPDAGAANNFLTGVTAAGAITKARPTCSNVSDAGVFCSAAAVTESQVTNLTTDLAGKAQIFFGTAAPGSVAGNLPGAQFTDTTNHHQYVCNAPAGTAAPACTSVAAAGWLQVDGTALGFTAENVANKSTDTTLGGGSPSNTLYGSQAAVKSYIDAHVGGTGVGRSVLSATWTAIPDFTCQAQTATWTGVTTADTVVIGAPSSYTSGLTPPVGWVTSANTVTINICNFSGGPVTPGSLSLSATLAIYNLSGSGTIDYTSIVDGACQNSTFTLTGVSAGDPLVPKWPATLESTIMPVGMVATAANTVQARVCNFSGGPIDPASNTFGASVAK